MKRATLGWAIALAATALAACSLAKMSSDADAAARLTYIQLRDGQDEALYARGTPELQSTPPAVLAQVRGFIPRERPTSSQVINWNIVSTPESERVDVQHEYAYRSGVVDTYTSLVRKSPSDPWRVYGFNVVRASNAQIQANAFSLANKRPGQYLFLLWALVSPLLMVAALVSAIRYPGLKRKWLWGVLAFAGVGGFHMNWTTGEMMNQLVSFQLIGAGVTKAISAIAPWIVSTTVPLGALLVLWRTRGRKMANNLRITPAGS